MISKIKVKKAIDDAEKQYLRCWVYLSFFKNRKKTDELFKAITEFQPTLAKALFKLSNDYQNIHKEKKRIIGNKDKYNELWFRQRLKKLSEYQKLIKEVIGIGKSLGDAYAWFFYNKERNYLNEHLTHQKIFHMPPGIGGIGELEFIKNTKVFENNLVIYHGITNILRIGDISLISLKNFKLSAIGEIKTKKISENRLNISVHFLGPIKTINDFSFSSKPNNNASQKKNDLPENMRQRLERQIKGMASSFGNSSKKPIEEKKIIDKTYSPELRKLYTKVKTNSITYHKAGDGLLFIAFKYKIKNLSSKLFNDSKQGATKKLTNLMEETNNIIDPSTNRNDLKLCSLHYDINSEANILPGTVPIFWWPIELHLLKSIYFQNVVICTVFNSLYLFRKLERIGLHIEWVEKKNKYIVSKKIGERIMQFEYFDYFRRLISEYLFTEDAVAKMLEEVMGTALKRQSASPIKIDINFFQCIGAPT